MDFKERGTDLDEAPLDDEVPQRDSSSEELKQLKEMGSDLSLVVGGLQRVSETMTREGSPATERARRRLREDGALRIDLTNRLKRMRVG